MVRENSKGLQKRQQLKIKDMKEKNIVLEWTAIEGKAASTIDSFIFTDRKEVRK